MREIVINKGLKRTKVLIYTDIDQLTAERFSKVNKYWMLHDELGSSFEEIDRIHMTRLILSINDKEKAKKVIDNMRVLIHNIINEVNPESLAFACLIHSIDGEEVTDLSDDNLKRIIKDLSDKGLTIDTLKKKAKETREGIYAELEAYFPDIFTNVLSIAFWSKIKQRTLKILNSIIDSKDIDLEDEDGYFAGMIHPKRLTGKYNDEIRYDNSFEQNCVVLSKFTNQPVKTLTTKEYFTLIQYFNKQNKK